MKLPEPLEFQWDEGNLNKSTKKHFVLREEVEEIFFDSLHKTFPDRVHSNIEERFRIIGKTQEKRLLFAVFTVRNEKIRVISARDVNRKEKPLYL